jgi:hypothetical protein
MLQIITTEEGLNDLMLKSFKWAMSNMAVPAPDQKATIIIDGEDLSKKLGITIQTLIRWRQKGKIPYLQIGNSIRYDLHKVLDSLESKNKGAKR